MYSRALKSTEVKLSVLGEKNCAKNESITLRSTAVFAQFWQQRLRISASAVVLLEKEILPQQFLPSKINYFETKQEDKFQDYSSLTSARWE